MTIHETCSCGSVFEFTCHVGERYPESQAVERADMQRTHDAFVERHKGCIESATIATLRRPGQSRVEKQLSETRRRSS